MLRWVIAVAIALTPSVAYAANGLRPRTPADFGDVPCMTTVDLGSVAHFDYGVAYDDVELTPEELPDSRTMQFFALRGVPFDYAMPVYITQGDFDRAEANGDNTQVYGADDILETASAWPAARWVPITPSDMRVPITMAQAAMGVDWDTTGVDPGGWLIGAYTFEPELNLWSFRFGAVRVVDPGDPDGSGPAGYFDAEPAPPPATAGVSYALSGCIEAGAGATYSASLGIIEGIDEPTWELFVDGESASNGAIDLSFTPPAAAAGKSVKVRLEVTDGSGKTFVTYSPFPVLVFEGEDDGGEESGSSGMADDGSGPTCECRAGPHRRGGGWAWLLVLLAVPRRRRASVR